MKFSITAEQSQALKQALLNFPDAEDLSGGEFVVDIYDADPPHTAHILISPSQLQVLAAAVLEEAGEEDAYMMGRKLTGGETESVARRLIGLEFAAT